MNPLCTTQTMTHATAVREQKGAIAAEITTAPNISYMTMFHETISRYWVLFSISSKNTFAFMNHTACFHLKFPQKYPVLPNCPISWFWD